MQPNPASREIVNPDVEVWGPPDIQTWTPETEDRWLRLNQLSEALQRGNVPLAAPPAGMNLQPGEVLHAIVGARRVEYYGTQESYRSGVGFIGGSGPFGIAMLAATATGSLLFNAASKNAAKRRAAEQWRDVDQGFLLITNQRLAMHGQQQWLDIWYPNISMSDCGFNGFQLHVSGEHPIGFLTTHVEWYYYLFRFLSSGRRKCPRVALSTEPVERRLAWVDKYSKHLPAPPTKTN
jgi:hypothetical protein